MCKCISLTTFLLACLIWLSQSVSAQTVSIYGYVATRYEKSFAVPEWNGTAIENHNQPAEFSYPFLNIMFQHPIDDHFKVFINLNGSKASVVDVRNCWGEYSPDDYFHVRLGKVYRKFGLYNEILDAVPTYYGIEPPEMFDSDHLMISRTTTLMLFGAVPLGPGKLHYAISTDNGEGSDISENAIPLGFDLRYTFNGRDFVVGASGYTSGGTTNSDVALGAGSPKSGVLPWMAADSFFVFDGYASASIGALTLEFEYAQANHEALRNAASVLEVLDKADMNEAQRRRFLLNPSEAPTLANINTVGDYTVKTWYVRAGYSFETSAGEVGPYVQWDWYSNPETIASTKYGGDNEAGIADDGVFSKATVGILFRPIAQIALKLDGSSHMYKFHGEDVSYVEGRFDVSYTFGL